MATQKKSKRRFGVGIDPGFGCTAVVLRKGDEKTPIACACATNKDTKTNIILRTHRMAMWLRDVLHEWIVRNEIEELAVQIESPIMNSTERGVVTLMTQMRLITAYEEMLFDLQRTVEIDIMLGEVHNQTAKQVFTGSGRADKTIMVVHSVWAKRPDVTQREHLADAQAISLCSPTLLSTSERDLVPMNSSYADSNIGNGPLWKGRK